MYTVQAQTKKKAPVKRAVTTRKAGTTVVQSTFAKPTSTLDSASYAFGMSMASSLKNDGIKSLNYDLLIKGLKDAFGEKPTLFTQEASQKAIGNLFNTIKQSKFSVNINEGKAFLENNKKNPSVKTTASGLQYLVITPGSGVMPKATDTVLVNYTGKLLSGKQFDSSYDRSEPLSITLNRVIPGWTEGVQLMSPGAKYKFFIPYQLAYGERGAGQDIPPYSTLIFEIELLKINGR